MSTCGVPLPPRPICRSSAKVESGSSAIVAEWARASGSSACAGADQGEKLAAAGCELRLVSTRTDCGSRIADGKLRSGGRRRHEGGGHSRVVGGRASRLVVCGLTGEGECELRKHCRRRRRPLRAVDLYLDLDPPTIATISGGRDRTYVSRIFRRVRRTSIEELALNFLAAFRPVTIGTRQSFVRWYSYSTVESKLETVFRVRVESKSNRETYIYVYAHLRPLTVSVNAGQQEFSSRTLWIVIPIMTLIIGPLFLLLVCAGYRMLISQLGGSAANRRQRYAPHPPLLSSSRLVSIFNIYPFAPSLSALLVPAGALQLPIISRVPASESVSRTLFFSCDLVGG